MPYGVGYGRTDSLGEDFTDLDSILEQDGRYTPNSNGHNNNNSNNATGYRISFKSVDDEELQRFMRALVTPVPNNHQSPSIDDYRNITNKRHYYDDAASDSSSSIQNPNNSRSESVMLFKKINDGDEDVSFDLVTSDLKDFIDPVMLEGIISRPSSCAPRSITPGQPSPVSPPLLHHTSERRTKKPENQQKQRTTNTYNGTTSSTILYQTKQQRASNVINESDERMNEMLSKSAQKTRELLEAMERSLKTEQTYATRRQQQQQLLEERRHSMKPQQRTRTLILDNEEKLKQKRQSLDLEGMLALRRDSDAILERRLSLLKVRANKLLQTDEQTIEQQDEKRRRQRRWSFTPIDEDPPSLQQALPSPTSPHSADKDVDHDKNKDRIMPNFQSVRARTLSMREPAFEKKKRSEELMSILPTASASNSESTISLYTDTTFRDNHRGVEQQEPQYQNISYMRRSDLRKSRTKEREPDSKQHSTLSSRMRLTVVSGDQVRAELMDDGLTRVLPNNHAVKADIAKNRQSAMSTHDLDIQSSQQMSSTSGTTDKSVAETAKELLDSIRQRRQSVAFERHQNAKRSTQQQQQQQQKEQPPPSQQIHQRLRARRKTVVANGLDNDDDYDQLTRRMRRLSVAVTDEPRQRQYQSKYLYKQEEMGIKNTSSLYND